MPQSLNFADLEIRLLEAKPEGFPVEITVDDEREFPRGYLDPSFLPWVPSASAREDGSRLYAWLFADDRLKLAWAETRGRSPERRIRLRIDASVPELHAIPWELLREVDDRGNPVDLAASSTTPFSRYLSGTWSYGEPVLDDRLKVLVAIANPQGLDQYKLAPVDAADEFAGLAAATAALNVELVPIDGTCTLSAIEQGLRQGAHVLHFVGHGVYSERSGGAVLFLANEENQVRRVEGAQFVEMLKRVMGDGGQSGQLRMVYLSSCQTATRSPADAFRGLAPQIVAAGVPAVLAMQDLVPIVTAKAFSQAFYRQLLQHGLVDLAANEARSAILTADLPGAAIPTLFMRLREGLLFDLSMSRAALADLLPYEPETVLIPAGPFPMGRDPGPDVPPDETPRHEVHLPAFRISKYPITNRQYAEFVKREPQIDVPKKTGWFMREPPADALDHPVAGVSWHEAVAYCTWLSAQSGRSYRLPTEAEWEKAAAGADGLLYPWGDTWQDGQCHVGGDEAAPVDAYPGGGSPYGCMDMLGNVQEWTSSLWGSDRQTADFMYPYDPDDGREEMDAEQHMHRVYRIHRGGSYRDDVSELRCSARGCSGPDSKIRWRGFRVVLDLGQRAGG